MSNLFAKYQPHGAIDRREPSRSVLVRELAESDIEPLALIAHQRNGGDLETHRDSFTRAQRKGRESQNDIVLTALLDDRPVAYGKAGVFVPPPDAPPNCAPAGWYLFGVVVAPEARRLGIGLELTRHRLAYIRQQRADAAYYFASALNLATIDLHARLGFEEVTRDFWFPRATFTGGVGILFRAALSNLR